MKKYYLIVLMALTVSMISLTACAAAGRETPGVDQAVMPNPASAYCEDQGYQLEIRSAENGSQTGYCLFPDGSECEEWAYYRGECGPFKQVTPLVPVTGETDQAVMPNPASAYCQEQGYQLEIRTEENGGQTAYCLFPDGFKCEEWAYYRGECGPPGERISGIYPTPLPIRAEDYQNWWTYTHPQHGFMFLLPEDWVVEDVTTSDPLQNHVLYLHPRISDPASLASPINIRLTFREAGESILLWPTGVGQGDFIPHGTLDIAGSPAQRMLLVCPTGEITSIWYHHAQEQAELARGGLEFGIIFSASPHCEPGCSLDGKTQWVGEMIIASLQVP